MAVSIKANLQCQLIQKYCFGIVKFVLNRFDCVAATT